MASTVEICNRALQILGAAPITSLDDDSRNARACTLAYDNSRLALLEKYVWGCAIKRAQLAAEATEPEFGKARSFPLPSDFVRLAPNYPEETSPTRDWEIEGRKILTNDSAPLNIRYIFSLTDPNEMNPLFREALSGEIAYQMCESLTQSNTKKADAKLARDEAIREARRVNGIQKVPVQTAESLWITTRR